MCKVYNSLGSLMTIKAHLREHNINEFNSIKELIHFQKSYPVKRQEIIFHHSVLIEQEKKALNEEIAALNTSITRKRDEVEQQLRLEIDQLHEQSEKLGSTTTNIFKAFFGYWKKKGLRKKNTRPPVAF